jgi:hypothetical protein
MIGNTASVQDSIQLAGNTVDNAVSGMPSFELAVRYGRY